MDTTEDASSTNIPEPTCTEIKYLEEDSYLLAFRTLDDFKLFQENTLKDQNSTNKNRHYSSYSNPITSFYSQVLRDRKSFHYTDSLSDNIWKDVFSLITEEDLAIFTDELAIWKRLMEHCGLYNCKTEFEHQCSSSCCQHNNDTNKQCLYLMAPQTQEIISDLVIKSFLQGEQCGSGYVFKISRRWSLFGCFFSGRVHFCHPIQEFRSYTCSKTSRVNQVGELVCSFSGLVVENNNVDFMYDSSISKSLKEREIADMSHFRKVNYKSNSYTQDGFLYKTKDKYEFCTLDKNSTSAVIRTSKLGKTRKYRHTDGELKIFRNIDLKADCSTGDNRESLSFGISRQIQLAKSDSTSNPVKKISRKLNFFSGENTAFEDEEDAVHSTKESDLSDVQISLEHLDKFEFISTYFTEKVKSDMISAIKSFKKTCLVSFWKRSCLDECQPVIFSIEYFEDTYSCLLDVVTNIFPNVFNLCSSFLNSKLNIKQNGLENNPVTKTKRCNIPGLVIGLVDVLITGGIYISETYVIDPAPIEFTSFHEQNCDISLNFSSITEFYHKRLREISANENKYHSTYREELQSSFATLENGNIPVADGKPYFSELMLKRNKSPDHKRKCNIASNTIRSACCKCEKTAKQLKRIIYHA